MNFKEMKKKVAINFRSQFQNTLKLNKKNNSVDELSYLQSGFFMEYELEDGILGQGSEGIVKKCKSLKNGMNYAVKIIRTEDTEMITKIHNEIQLMKNLKHKNIITLFEIFREEQFHFYLVFEYAEGITLNKWMKEEGEYSNIVHIFQSILYVVKFLHNLKICHRDLKPQNIIVNPKILELKVIDFGISKRLVTEEENMCTPAGTNKYMAPEIHDSAFYDFKVDIWSIGKIFEKKLEDADIIRKMLDPNPVTRYSASQLLEIL